MAIEAKNRSGTAHAPRRIRLGMVGGGEGAFIGAVHRIAARLDDHYELVAGALSASADNARRSGQALGLTPERSYADYAAMARAEAARDDGIEAVSIVTPNHLHAPVAEAFLKAGIHVICDKPVTTTSRDAKKLLALVNRTGRIFAVTHNYSGYPMVRHAQQMVREGQLGEIRLVQVEYPQDWLTEPLERSGQKQAAWRTDPARSGAGGAIGDIGTHAHQLAAYVTGLELDEVCAELSRFVKGRELDDNAQVMLRYRNGARGLLWASQVAPGNENNLRLRVYGSKGGIDWHQEQPNQLHWSPFGQPTQTIGRGTGAANAAAARVSRIPSGHPEGYLEGFATLYAEIAQAIRAARLGGPKADKAAHFPTLLDGLKGVEFIEAVVKSSARGGRWVRLPR
jgi:predicted dehydrogenase